MGSISDIIARGVLELLLLRTREYVERGWTQNASARDKDGHTVSFCDKDAICWCLMGAAGRAAYDYNGNLATYGSLIDALHELAGRFFIAEWNDAPGRTREEVLALIDQTIAGVRENG